MGVSPLGSQSRGSEKAHSYEVASGWTPFTRDPLCASLLLRSHPTSYPQILTTLKSEEQHMQFYRQGS